MRATYEEDQDIVPEHDVSVLSLRNYKKNSNLHSGRYGLSWTRLSDCTARRG